jgi:hypothetical protein
MMNWGALLHIPWVLGLAVILAALSWARYQAGRDRLSMPAGIHLLRKRLDGPGFQLPLSLGLALVSASLLLTAHVLWERGVWSISLLFWLVSLVQRVRQSLRRA